MTASLDGAKIQWFIWGQFVTSCCFITSVQEFITLQTISGKVLCSFTATRCRFTFKTILRYPMTNLPSSMSPFRNFKYIITNYLTKFNCFQNYTICRHCHFVFYQKFCIKIYPHHCFNKVQVPFCFCSPTLSSTGIWINIIFLLPISNHILLLLGFNTLKTK